MKELPPGLYERLLTAALKAGLENYNPAFFRLEDLQSAEAPDRIALHVSRVLQRALAGFSDADRLSLGAELAANLIEQIGGMAPEIPLPTLQVLKAIHE